MRLYGFASLLTLLFAPALVRADDTLVLDLPPINGSTAQQTVQQAPPVATSHPHINPAAHVGTLPSRQGPVDRWSDQETVIGKLAVSAAPASIHIRRSFHSRMLAEIRPGTYLALVKEAGDWYGVLMSDRSTGWLPKHAVNVLNYDVVSTAPHYASSRGTAGWAQRAILAEAYKFLGVPYKWGGESWNGLDCSAFVKHCFGILGINLPRTAHEQAQIGMAVSVPDLQMADRLYFADRDGRITHTGIYIGNGYFIHSSSSRHGVAVSRLDEPLYAKMFCGARR